MGIIMNYRFEITYADKKLIDISKLMSKLDLGMRCVCTKEIITFSSVNDLNIIDIKNIITEGYESCGCEIYKIAGGKIE